jgi:hypothetical protein
MARFTLSPSRLARFFFHDCERHLRYHATPARRAAAEGVPALAHAGNPVTEAVLEGGREGPGHARVLRRPRIASDSFGSRWLATHYHEGVGWVTAAGHGDGPRAL